jgi:hypothetical protein
VARQQLTPQTFTKDALLNPTYSALTGSTGISFPWSPQAVVGIINGATASTATINLGVTVEGQSVTPFSVALPTSNTAPQFLGPFSSRHAQADGNVYIDLSSVATVTAAVLQLPGVS